MIRIEKEGSVWTVVRSRIEAKNAMDPASADALCAAFKAFEQDNAAHVAVLWGEGGAFCSGWDLKYAATLDDPARFNTEIIEGLAWSNDAASDPQPGSRCRSRSSPLLTARRSQAAWS